MEKLGSQKKRINGSIPGWSLARDFYKDPEIFEKEKEKIIFDNWIFAGHVSQIQNSGDYFLFNLLEESVIIVRGNDMEIRAFFNVCRHRGSHVCLEKSGNSKRFLCPYHAWTYDIDGSLFAARGMPDSFDKSNHGLHPCAMDIIEGMVFINFGDNPVSLENVKRDLAGPLKMYDFNNLKVATHKRYPIDGNWKITLENYQECYHCAPSHPEYSLSHTFKVEDDKFEELQKPMLSRMEALGVGTHEYDYQFDKQQEGQENYACSRYALFEKYKTGSQDGKPLAPLLGNLLGYDHGALDINIGSFTYYLCYNDHIIVYVFTPTEHEKSACDIYWLVRNDAEEGKDYDLDKLTWLWNATTLADERIIVDNQKGVNSKKYQSGPLAIKEKLIERYIVWYLHQLAK